MYAKGEVKPPRKTGQLGFLSLLKRVRQHMRSPISVMCSLKNPQGSVPKTLCLGISICLCLFNFCILLLLLKVDGSQISSICLHAAQVTSRHLFRLLTVNRQKCNSCKKRQKTCECPSTLYFLVPWKLMGR